MALAVALALAVRHDIDDVAVAARGDNHDDFVADNSYNFVYIRYYYDDIVVVAVEHFYNHLNQIE